MKHQRYKQDQTKISLYNIIYKTSSKFYLNHVGTLIWDNYLWKPHNLGKSATARFWLYKCPEQRHFKEWSRIFTEIKTAEFADLVIFTEEILHG